MQPSCTLLLIGGMASLHIKESKIFNHPSFIVKANMLPSLGLFKSIPCPLYPNCSRNPCFYLHKTQRADDGRPSEQIKRQKLAPEAAKKAASPASSSSSPSSSIGKAAPTTAKGKTIVPSMTRAILTEICLQRPRQLQKQDLSHQH